MKSSSRLDRIAAAILLLLAGPVSRSQTESGLPICGDDGKAPNGQSQCECADSKLYRYRGEYHDGKNEFRVKLPDDVVGVGSCAPGDSFRVDLAHPNSGKNPSSLNSILVSGNGSRRYELDVLAERFAQEEKEKSEEIHATDLVIEQPTHISLSTLAAIHLRATRTEPDGERMSHEWIIANNPEKEIVYTIGMVSPTENYKKDHRLFEAMVKGFQLDPAGGKGTH